jgi:hypothetical protein
MVASLLKKLRYGGLNAQKTPVWLPARSKMPVFSWFFNRTCYFYRFSVDKTSYAHSTRDSDNSLPQEILAKTMQCRGSSESEYILRPRLSALLELLGVFLAPSLSRRPRVKQIKQHRHCI